MKKKNLVLLAVIIMASTTVLRAQAQSKNDSLLQNLAKSINALVEFKMTKNSSDTVVKVINASPSSNTGLSISDKLQIKENTRKAEDRSYGITSIDLGNGDYSKKYDGSFAGMGFNTPETFASPIAFNHFNGNLSYISTGYEWGSESRKWNDCNWWLTKTFSRKTTLSFNWFNTNEYTASLNGDYVARFAHNLLSLGCNFDGGVYSSVKDSTMKPYFYGGINGSIFCLYGSIGLSYSKNITYESMYDFTGNFIPIYEIGVKSPSIKINGDFLLDISAVYCNYSIYQPAIYVYNESGNVVEDTSGILDTDLYKGSVSVSDHYGNLLQFGVSSWDSKNFTFGLSGKFNLRNIGRYF